MPNDDDEQLMWMDEEAGADDGERGTAATNPGRGSAELEGDLLRVRAELAEVRRDLAAKTVQLTRREKVTLDEKVQEIAATVNEERDQQLQQALSQVEQLKLSVSLRGEELEESRRLYAGQKRALREAMNAVAERETVEKDAEESTRTAHAQALEDELDALTHELAMTKARGDMELRAREGELGSLRTQLAGATQRRKQAVAEAEAALTEAWEAEVARLQREAEETATQLDGQLVRLMTQIEDARREDTSSSLTAELAALNKQKVQVQREFSSFKDMAMETSRTNREEVAKLLSENAELHSRLAAKTLDMAGVGMGGGASTSGRTAALAASPKMFEASYGTSGLDPYLPAFLVRLERERKGALPVIIIGVLLTLILFVAVVRAAANTHAQHQGSLCFLSNLGIRIGSGCQDVGTGDKSLVELMEKGVHRVHDVQDLTLDAGVVADVPEAPAGGTATTRRLLMSAASRLGGRVLGRVLNHIASDDLADMTGSDA